MALERMADRDRAMEAIAADLTYESARRQLSRALHDVADELAQGDLDPATARLLAVRRAAVIEEGLRFFGPINRFVRHEVGRWVDPDALEATWFAVDDVIASIYLTAVDHADEAPGARAFYTWLRRIARREVRHAVMEAEALQRTEQSLYHPVRAVGEWPDHVVRLITILADTGAPIPEDVLVARETRNIVYNVLRKLPEQWREVFLLSAVDGWDDKDIAEAEGLEVRAVRAIVDASRTFLRDWLQDDAAFASV